MMDEIVFRLFSGNLEKAEPMKQDYWNVSDEQLMEKTGKKSSDWIQILDDFHAAGKKSNDVVAHLQTGYQVPRYWARTLTTLYLKQKDS